MRQAYGFTLIEFVVALLIFTVGVLGFMKLQGETIRGNAFGQQLTTAISLAQNQAEDLVQGGVASPSLDFGTHNAASQVRSGVTYDLAWTVTSMGSAAAPRQVAPAVTWQERLLPHHVNLVFVTASNQVGN